MSTSRVCVRCGTENALDNNRCVACGFDLMSQLQRDYDRYREQTGGRTDLDRSRVAAPPSPADEARPPATRRRKTNPNLQSALKRSGTDEQPKVTGRGAPEGAAGGQTLDFGSAVLSRVLDEQAPVAPEEPLEVPRDRRGERLLGPTGGANRPKAPPRPPSATPSDLLVLARAAAAAGPLEGEGEGEGEGGEAPITAPMQAPEPEAEEVAAEEEAAGAPPEEGAGGEAADAGIAEAAGAEADAEAAGAGAAVDDEAAEAAGAGAAVEDDVAEAAEEAVPDEGAEAEAAAGAPGEEDLAEAPDEGDGAEAAAEAIAEDEPAEAAAEAAGPEDEAEAAADEGLDDLDDDERAPGDTIPDVGRIAALAQAGARAPDLAGQTLNWGAGGPIGAQLAPGADEAPAEEPPEADEDAADAGRTLSWDHGAPDLGAAPEEAPDAGRTVSWDEGIPGLDAGPPGDVVEAAARAWGDASRGVSEEPVTRAFWEREAQVPSRAEEDAEAKRRQSVVEMPTSPDMDTVTAAARAREQMQRAASEAGGGYDVEPITRDRKPADEGTARAVTSPGAKGPSTRQGRPTPAQAAALVDRPRTRQGPDTARAKGNLKEGTRTYVDVSAGASRFRRPDAVEEGPPRGTLVAVALGVGLVVVGLVLWLVLR